MKFNTISLSVIAIIASSASGATIQRKSTSNCQLKPNFDPAYGQLCTTPNTLEACVATLFCDWVPLQSDFTCVTKVGAEEFGRFCDLNTNNRLGCTRNSQFCDWVSLEPNAGDEIVSVVIPVTETVISTAFVTDTATSVVTDIYVVPAETTTETAVITSTEIETQTLVAETTLTTITTTQTVTITEPVQSETITETLQAQTVTQTSEETTTEPGPTVTTTILLSETITTTSTATVTETTFQDTPA
eukprot:Awhi_evm2s9682